MAQAYELEPEHPTTLNLLAHLCLVRGDYRRAELLAAAASDLAGEDGPKAESLTLLARAWHAQGQSAKAMQYYLQVQKAPLIRM